MNKKVTSLLIGLLALIIIISGVVVYKKKHPKDFVLPVRQSTNAEVLISPSTLITTADDKALAHRAWTTFIEYIAFAKAHDTKGLSTLTYKLSANCTDPSKVKECNSAMDGLVALRNILDENMFTHIMYDSKQIILSTDYKKEENKQVRGYSHAVIYFIRDKNDALKIVGFGPSQGRYLAKLPGQTDLELETALADRLVDTDKDGVADFVEVCKDPSPNEVCVKTDPLNRDTDKNGYWDGIQKFLDNK